MRILDVISSIDPRDGGPSAGVMSSASACARLGHRRDVLCLDSPDAPWVKAAATNVFAIGVGCDSVARWPKSLPGAQYGHTGRLPAWLRARARDYDAVIVNGLWNYASLGSWRALRGERTPYFVYPHGMLDPWFNQAYPLKTVYKTMFWKGLEHRVVRDARGVFFTSEEERRLASQSFAPYAAREYVVGYGARDPDFDPNLAREAFVKAAPAIRFRKYLLFLSRVHKKKGVDLLISGFASIRDDFPDLDLVIAGPGDEGLVANLRRLASNLGVSERIHWVGMLAGDAKWGAFASAEFFVLPSHQENFGVVVAEALALAKPVLITNKVNIWREIRDDGAGWVVSDDQQGVTNGLRHMLTLSAQQRSEMGRRARNCFLGRFDMIENAKAFLALLDKLSSGDASSE